MLGEGHQDIERGIAIYGGHSEGTKGYREGYGIENIWKGCGVYSS